METNLHQEVIGLINSKIEFIKKFSVERFKDKWLIDIVLNNTMLNVSVNSKIVVDINNSMNKHVLDFYKNEKVFGTYADFELFLNTIIKGYTEKTKGLYVKYINKQYLCNIDVLSVDADRQMGTETVYEVTFTDSDGNVIKAAEINEYPMGFFSIHNINRKVELNVVTALNYFHDQTENYELS